VTDYWPIAVLGVLLLITCGVILAVDLKRIQYRGHGQYRDHGTR